MHPKMGLNVHPSVDGDRQIYSIQLSIHLLILATTMFYTGSVLMRGMKTLRLISLLPVRYQMNPAQTQNLLPMMSAGLEIGLWISQPYEILHYPETQ
jgi:uncharacterized membrane protein YGL010W